MLVGGCGAQGLVLSGYRAFARRSMVSNQLDLGTTGDFEKEKVIRFVPLARTLKLSCICVWPRVRGYLWVSGVTTWQQALKICR